jgi:hypothetical protein
MSSRGCFATPADFPLHDASPYEGYTSAAKVWDSSLVQGPFPVAPCQTIMLRFATFTSLVGPSSFRGTSESLSSLPEAEPRQRLLNTKRDFEFRHFYDVGLNAGGGGGGGGGAGDDDGGRVSGIVWLRWHATNCGLKLEGSNEFLLPTLPLITSAWLGVTGARERERMRRGARATRGEAWGRGAPS